MRENIVDPIAAAAISACDAIFLAADSMQARHVVNAICHQYLIPGFQVGAKVHVTKDGDVGEVYAVSRILGVGALCMWCSELIDPTRLQREALSPEQARGAGYVDEVPSPSVISMNTMSTALALNDFLFMFTGLSQTADMGPRWYDFRRRAFSNEVLASSFDPGCPQCAGLKAMGDGRRLPLRYVDTASALMAAVSGTP